MRKKVIRIMACIYVFFVVLQKQFNVIWKQRLATGSCAVVMAVALCISCFGQPVEKGIAEQQQVAEYATRSHNNVINADKMASIQINQSSVVDKNGGQESANIVKKDKLETIGQAVDKNRVVENPVALSEIHALYENYGTRPDSDGEKIRYQYPVEIGYPVDYNYDGRQTAGDYVYRDILDTVSEKKDTKEDLAIDNSIEDMSESETTEANKTEETDLNDGTEEEEVITESTATTEEVSSDNGDADIAPGTGTQNESDEYITTEADIEKEQTDQTSTEQEEVQRSEEEQKKTENFQKNVWNAIMPTVPVQRNLTDKEKQESSKPEDVSAKETAQDRNTDGSITDDDGGQKTETADEGLVNTENESREVSQTLADDSYFVVQGKRRDGVEAFVGDVIITPTGKNGYSQVKVGEDGEFGSRVVLTKDGMNQKAILFFSNGTDVTSGVEYTYSKDVTAPTLAFSGDGLTRLEGKDKIIYCTNEANIPVAPRDNIDEQEQTGIDRICYIYGDKLKYLVDHFENAALQVDNRFYGRILANCSDKAGNTSDIVSKFYLVEPDAPVITMVEDELCTAPYTLWVNVTDMGSVVSGIHQISCMVNGQEYDITNEDVLQQTMIDDGITVPSQYEFPVSFTEEGTYEVVVNVTDNAGNSSSMTRTLQVTRPELVSVYMPETFTVHIDPQQLAGKEQIFSDDITLRNNSEFDVKVTIKNVKLKVNDEMSDSGVKKDADIYLIAPDTGDRILLKKGSNKNVYSYVLPENTTGDIANLKFVGTTTKGSDSMWKDSDISIQVQLEFEK